MRDIESIDCELRSVAAVSPYGSERGRPLPLMDGVDALLDERLGARRTGYDPRDFLNPDVSKRGSVHRNKRSSGLLPPAREIAETTARADALVDESLRMTQKQRGKQ
jgi:hypothetical protein